jgi:glycosyltransferase involved in cell wall biosynthesis
MYTIGVILPSAKLFGGIRRFFELGERFTQQGHRMIILTPEGIMPDWFNYNSTVDKIANISQYNFTALFAMQKEALNQLLNASASIRIFYHILKSEEIKEVIKHPEIKIFANSTNILQHDKKKYGIDAILLQGGVNLPATIKDVSKNDDVFTIMCFGRLGRMRKGTRFVVRAAEKLYRQGYEIKLLLFDTPVDEKSQKLVEKFTTRVPFEFVLNHPVAENESLFKRASVFVSAEKNAGWSNSSAEALSCGIPLIATLSGTKDFLIHNKTGLVVWRNSFSIARALKKLIKDKQLRVKLSINGRKKIESYGWDDLAAKILSYIDNLQPAVYADHMADQFTGTYS